MDALTIGQFALATILPSLATYALLRLRSRCSWGFWPWQILCGVIFGLIAVFGTEFGIHTDGATMNVRDAAPVAAGLFFGGPAGIIAGLIGGIERWFAALWGRGMFTRTACTLGTCAAGCYAALLKWHVFEGRKPSWHLSAVTGIVVEVLHLLLIFITNPENPTRAFAVVRACTPPMITCNAIAMALCSLATAKALGEKRRSRGEVHSISHILQVHLLTVTIVGFVVSALFTLALQGGLATTETQKLLTLALQDAKSDIYTASDKNLLDLTSQVTREISTIEEGTQETIDWLVEELDVTEINVVNEKGIVVASSNADLVGFDIASGEQSAEFLMLLPGGGAAQIVQSYQPMSFDPDVWRKYAGMRIKDGFVQVAYDADHFLEDLSERIDSCVSNRHVGQEGALIVVDQNGALVATRNDLHPSSSDVASLVIASQSYRERTVFACTFMETPYYASYRVVEGFRLFALESVEAAELERDLSVLVTCFMEVLVFASLFVAIYQLIRNEVVESIWRVNGTLGQITGGDLEAQVSVQNNAEFVSLSRDINTMVASLRNAIDAEASRIDAELEYAAAIQENALPRTFPPFPEIDSFDIYAQMRPAREVGGDFYDFFLVNDHTLGFLVADVSGKGIPASLFMMAAKTELSNYMSSNMTLADAVQTANWHLCQGNETGMFVTVWAATLDYETGELTYVNAGHNHPLLRHNGTWTWLHERGGLFLGTFDTAKYRSHTLTLVPGDELFVYSDGVNEAFSADDEQYGNKRLENFLKDHAELHPRPLIDALSADLTRWATGAEQSDDITMLTLEYGVAPQATGSLTVPATLDQFDAVLNFIHSALLGRSCPLKAQFQLDIVIEELFVNVCNYAYKDRGEVGTATFNYVYNANPSSIAISISDEGVPFDPLSHTDPTAPSSIAEAKIGGLGIMMVKRMTDDLSYVRDGNKNVVAFIKKW